MKKLQNQTQQAQQFISCQLQKALVAEIKALNGVMGANWLFEKIKAIHPAATFMDMGFDGGYSPVLQNEKLTDYNGKTYTGPLTIEEFQKSGEVAFGTIGIEICETYYQVYHNGREFFLEDINGIMEIFTDATAVLKHVKENVLSKLVLF